VRPTSWPLHEGVCGSVLKAQGIRPFLQDDIILGTLTVRENLHFSAALRLPGETTWEERKKRVDEIIEDLGLQSCAYTKV
jgi:ABC-type multidrug transport system ATPase subunit